VAPFHLADWLTVWFSHHSNVANLPTSYMSWGHVPPGSDYLYITVWSTTNQS